MLNKETRWLLKEKYENKKTPEFFADTKRLNAGEPLAYVIGWVDFLECHIDLSAHPLIPRPETEFWVESAISHQSLATSPIKILDLFSGSGCIGVALLKHLPRATVDFGEKDPKLCQQIKKNVTLNSINPTRTCIIETDVFFNIADSYDYIFANPPYVDATKKETVQESVLAHEPHEALFADDNGLFFIKKLLMEGMGHLKQGGTMYVEFGEGQKDALATLAKNTGWKAKFQKDKSDKWRIAMLTIV